MPTSRNTVKNEALLKNGKPKALHVVSIVAAPQGVEYVKQHLTSADTLWLGSIDDGLNEKAYIVPGLGDAGDLAFGPKL